MLRETQLVGPSHGKHTGISFVACLVSTTPPESMISTGAKADLRDETYEVPRKLEIQVTMGEDDRIGLINELVGREGRTKKPGKHPGSMALDWFRTQRVAQRK